MNFKKFIVLFFYKKKVFLKIRNLISETTLQILPKGILEFLN